MRTGQVTGTMSNSSCTSYFSGNVYSYYKPYIAESKCPVSGPFLETTTIFISGKCELSGYGSSSCVGRIIITPY